MAKYVEFPLEGGGSIYIEASDEIGRGSAGFVRDESASHKAATSFDDSLEAIRRSADLLVSKLRGLSTPPDELQVNFSLKASGELGGLMIAKTGTDANFSVMLKWQAKKPDEKKDDDRE